jgi:uncharacterized protein YkwD
LARWLANPPERPFLPRRALRSLRWIPVAAAVLAAGCTRSPALQAPAARPTASRGPSTETERRAYLLLEDRCLVDSGPPCSWSDALAAAAGALAGVLRREGREAIRSETLVRAELHRAGVGHPNAMAAALFVPGREPAERDLAAFVAGLEWPFRAREFGVGVDAPVAGPDGDAGAASSILVVVAAEPLVEIDPPPRWLPQEAVLTFGGRLLPGFVGLRALLADPSGGVREIAVTVDAAGRFRGALPIGSAPGRYVFELTAERGDRGPLVLYLLSIELSSSPPPEPGADAGEVGATSEPSAAEERMAALVAQFRAERGLPALRRDAALDAVARAHAEDMARNGFFGHVSPTRGDLDDRLRAGRANLARAGENLAFGPSAEAAFGSLLESPAHRANFLDPTFDRFGLAAATDGDSLVFDVVLGAD